MNLLNNIFNFDAIEISSINKKYFFILVIIVLIIVFLLFMEKSNYYIGTYQLSGKEIVLLVDKDNINKVKNNKKIIINDIENDYSINKITPVDDIFMVSIKMKTKINNISSGSFKIYLGKEKIFDYIMRIIKK